MCMTSLSYENKMSAANSKFDSEDSEDSEDGELRDDDNETEMSANDRRRAAPGPQTPPEPHQMVIGNDSDDGQEDALTIKPPQAQTHKQRSDREKERAERRERKTARKSSDMPHRSKDRHRGRSGASNARSSDRTGRSSGSGGVGSRADRRAANGRERRHKDGSAKEPPDGSNASSGRRSGRIDDILTGISVTTAKDRPDRSRDRDKERDERERDRQERVESEKRRDRLIYADRERERLRERQKRELDGRRQTDSSDSHSRDRSPVTQERPKNAEREGSSRTKRQSPRADQGSKVQQRTAPIGEKEEHLVIVASDPEDDDDVEEIVESDGDAIVVEELSEQSAGEIVDDQTDDDDDDDGDDDGGEDQWKRQRVNDDEDEKDAMSVNGESDAFSNASSVKNDRRRTGSEGSTPQSHDQNSVDERNGDGDGDDDDQTDGGEMAVTDGEDGDDANTADAYLADESPPSKPEPQLPPYLPAIQGCRNVEEFDCLNRIEEGTYGVVYRARHKKTQEIVALKRLKMEKERDGFPITSLREINTLLKAQHPNIVTVREIVVGSNMDKIYIVMDYVEHDLKSLMETMRQPFLIGEVKTLMIQLLRAVAHLHDNWILHRDLKTSNLLLSHKGVLKVGDFGLAREYGSPLKHYTPVVVTLWYRAPELLLGSKDYSTPIDVWSVGCIFGELLTMKPLFPGKSDINQLHSIFKDMGTPNEQIWPGYSELPMVKRVTFTDIPYSNLRRRFEPTFTNCGMDMLNKLLYFDPKRRVSAEEALKHKYFAESPKPVDPSLFPTWPAKSELAAHVRTQQSPKPPSGGKQYAKQLANDDDDVACAGFHMGEPQDTAIPRAGEMFRLRF